MLTALNEDAAESAIQKIRRILAQKGEKPLSEDTPRQKTWANNGEKLNKPEKTKAKNKESKKAAKTEDAAKSERQLRTAQTKKNVGDILYNGNAARFTVEPVIMSDGRVRFHLPKNVRQEMKLAPKTRVKLLVMLERI